MCCCITAKPVNITSRSLVVEARDSWRNSKWHCNVVTWPPSGLSSQHTLPSSTTAEEHRWRCPLALWGQGTVLSRRSAHAPSGALDVHRDDLQHSAQYTPPLNLSVRRGGINRLHSPIAQDGPCLEVGLVEVFEKILEAREDRFVEVHLEDVGLLCLLEGSSCGCAPDLL